MGEVSNDFIVPDVLKIRPVAVRISTDNNGGYMVWGSKSCSGSKSKKKIDDKEYEYYEDIGCVQSEDDEWLDLMAGTDVINAELNSQSFPVPPGDYAWVSIIMCAVGTLDDGSIGGLSSTVKNKAYQAGHMTASAKQ